VAWGCCGISCATTELSPCNTQQSCCSCLLMLLCGTRIDSGTTAVQQQPRWAQSVINRYYTYEYHALSMYAHVRTITSCIYLVYSSTTAVPGAYIRVPYILPSPCIYVQMISTSISSHRGRRARSHLLPHPVVPSSCLQRSLLLLLSLLILLRLDRRHRHDDSRPGPDRSLS